jgi:predicted phosphohydrolase
MKYYYYSDLHNDLEDVLTKEEFRQGKTRVFTPPSFTDEANSVLLLAGDIDEIKRKDNPRLTNYLKSLSERFKAVVYIMGNHEFYKSKLNEGVEKLKERVAFIDNLYILDNEVLELDNCVIIGSTLWTNYDDHNVLLMRKSTEREGGLRDFRKITYKSLGGYRRLMPSDVVAEFLKSKNFIFNEIKKAKQKNKDVLVMTHHAPSFKSCMGTEFDGAYGSDIEKEIIESEPNVWIHGHVHETKDYWIGKTRVLCNPRGYYPSDVNDNFNEKAFVKI